MSVTASHGITAFHARSLVRVPTLSSASSHQGNRIARADFIQFRSLLRYSNRFAAYNFREYAKRRTKDAFRDHQRETDGRKVQDLLSAGAKELQMLKVRTPNAAPEEPFGTSDALKCRG